MTLLLIAATVAVCLMMLMAWLPEFRTEGALLRRWSKGGGEPRCSETVQNVVDGFIEDFSATHSLTEAETARIREMKTRPGMMPVTLLLHPQLVTREKGRFGRGRNLTSVFVATGVSALIMPPLAGMAMHNMSLWLLPFLNTAVFFAGLQLLRYAYSDLGLMNVLVTGKAD
ncbi:MULTISPECIES: hypothetical protein [Pantoea]|uniref:Uncharacterized protein n=1 Tax=Pantoea septica TaxID=472695 RepID=A0ABX3UMR7_9GAMM|nr:MULTISPECIES: hypothetical protein [Pantoea]MBZ6388699.1 hypothetical protein [Pantoea piersonii]MBZ6402492.1 hypothetical protein [Pantoea piersonii]MBZ6410690.1 hypothetical protein [Pantoea piersonii]MBZ6429360.1 hypothetical protein [Pantoea piersonii]MDU5476268.1 hypothetical protein [Pantoea sp.]